MYDHPGPGRPPPLARPPQAWLPEPDWHRGVPPRAPSGLFPSGPVRPTYREPHPVRGSAVAAGIAGTVGWLLAFGLLGRDLRGYAWWTIVASLAAWLVALLLGRHGDRGVAAGVTVATAIGVSIVATVVGVRWAATAVWPLW